MKTIALIIALLLVVGLGVYSFWQGQRSKQIRLRPSILAVVDTMENGAFEGSNLNMMGRKPIPSSQFARFVFLADSATTTELIQLVSHRSPVVRSYAFDALAERNPPNFLDLIVEHLKDSTRFQTHFFDMIGYSSVAEHVKYTTLANYLSKFSVPNSHYSLIRDLATSKEVPTAIVALAKFKKSQDIPTIEAYLDEPRLLTHGISAIAEFPSPQLYPRLLEIHQQDLKRGFTSIYFCLPFYKAIVRYRREESLEILRTALADREGFSAKITKISIYIALQKFPDAYFHKIREAIVLSPDEATVVKELMSQTL